MNAPTFTPGPWRTLDTYVATFSNDGRDEAVTEIQHAVTGELLCYANPQHAQSICTALDAAPELYEALRQIADPFSHPLQKPEAIVAKLRNIARAALAKVTP